MAATTLDPRHANQPVSNASPTTNPPRPHFGARSHPKWLLYDLDAKETFHGKCYDETNFPCPLWNEHKDELMWLFGRPAPPHLRECILPEEFRNTPTCPQMQSFFCSLPLELLMKIFDILNRITLDTDADYRERAHSGTLMLTCKKLWHVGLAQMAHIADAAYVGRWAGHRTMYAGDSRILMPPGVALDWPLSWSIESQYNDTTRWFSAYAVDKATGRLRLTERGEARIRETQKYYSKGVREHIDRAPPGHLQTDMYTAREPAALQNPYWMLQLGLHATHLTPLEARLARCLDGALAMHYPAHATWVLRNLTAKKYVRGDGLAAFEGDFEITDPEWRPSVTQALVNKICWSMIGWNKDRRDAWYVPREGMNMGEWAGHRVDFVVAEVHEAEVDGSWEDVTAEAIAELAEIFHDKVVPKTKRKVADEEDDEESMTCSTQEGPSKRRRIET